MDHLVHPPEIEHDTNVVNVETIEMEEVISVDEDISTQW